MLLSQWMAQKKVFWVKDIELYRFCMEGGKKRKKQN